MHLIDLPLCENRSMLSSYRDLKFQTLKSHSSRADICSDLTQNHDSFQIPKKEDRSVEKIYAIQIENDHSSMRVMNYRMLKIVNCNQYYSNLLLRNRLFSSRCWWWIFFCRNNIATMAWDWDFIYFCSTRHAAGFTLACTYEKLFITRKLFSAVLRNHWQASSLLSSVY